MCALFSNKEITMKIIEAINRYDKLKPNGYTREEKIRWLSDLDERVKAEVIDTHEGFAEVSFSGYNGKTDLDTELLIPAPYDEVYISWLESRIDYMNAEIARYNNSIANVNAIYADFVNYYNRTHRPLTAKFKFF